MDDEHFCRVADSLSYSGDPGDKSRPQEPVTLTGFLWFFRVPPGKCWLGHDCFLPYLFQFIIPYLLFTQHCIVGATDSNDKLTIHI
jgi:hypothetical protein